MFESLASCFAFRCSASLDMTKRQLFRALEFAGEKIIHHQRRDESGDTKILLRIVIERMELKLVAAVGESREELVDSKFLLIGPLANRVQQSPSTLAQI